MSKLRRVNDKNYSYGFYRYAFTRTSVSYIFFSYRVRLKHEVPYPQCTIKSKNIRVITNHREEQYSDFQQTYK